jgi:hypothetical protein
MKTYTQDEAAEELGVSRFQLWRWRNAGHFRVGSKRPGRRGYVFTDADLAVIRKWLATTEPLDGE